MLSPLRTTVAAAVGFLVLASPAKAWTWPASGPVLQAFRYGSDPYAAGQHRGIDVGGDAGAPVAAPRTGVVSFAGSLPTNGLSVTIETADGFSVTLVHLGSIAVTRGGHVAEGQAVGAIGPSGTAEQDAPYVHLGIRTTSDQNGYLDPLAFLPARTAQPAGEASAHFTDPCGCSEATRGRRAGGSCAGVGSRDAVAGSGCRQCTGRGCTGRSGSRGSRADVRHATGPGAGQGGRACAGASGRRAALGREQSRAARREPLLPVRSRASGPCRSAARPHLRAPRKWKQSVHHRFTQTPPRPLAPGRGTRRRGLLPCVPRLRRRRSIRMLGLCRCRPPR